MDRAAGVARAKVNTETAVEAVFVGRTANAGTEGESRMGRRQCRKRWMGDGDLGRIVLVQVPCKFLNYLMF